MALPSVHPRSFLLNKKAAAPQRRALVMALENIVALPPWSGVIVLCFLTQIPRFFVHRTRLGIFPIAVAEGKIGGRYNLFCLTGK